jgi:adenylyltransferase/sulfurtransferase
LHLRNDEEKKAKAVATLIESKNPFIKVLAFDMDFEAFKGLGNTYDLILDATDNLPVRAEIDNYAKKTNTPWIYASVEEFNGQICFFDKANFEVFNISDHKPGGIAAPIVIISAHFRPIWHRYLGLSVVKISLLSLLQQ